MKKSHRARFRLRRRVGAAMVIALATAAVGVGVVAADFSLWTPHSIWPNGNLPPDGDPVPIFTPGVETSACPTPPALLTTPVPTAGAPNELDAPPGSQSQEESYWSQQRMDAAAPANEEATVPCFQGGVPSAPPVALPPVSTVGVTPPALP
jgi:hypothetical protein